MIKLPLRCCPVCDHDASSVFFEIPEAPVHCNILYESKQAAEEAPRSRIRLAFCESCGMIFNQAFDARLMEYDGHYENSLHYSPRFQEYALNLSRRLVSSYGIRNKDVVDIGCGDAHFLALLCREGHNQGWGFDPSQNVHAASAQHAGTSLVLRQEVFSGQRAPAAAQLICCRHVLEHIERPSDLLTEVQQATARGSEDAIVFFEVPDARYTLEHGGIWDILYEHCSYFSPPSLTRLFVKHGFNVLRVKSDYEGQFLQIDAAARHSLDASEPDLTEQVDDLAASVKAFRKDYRESVIYWTESLKLLRQERKQVALWGAGTKGVMFLNAIDESAAIGRVVDVNPRKRGHFVSGTGHEIIAPRDLLAWQPDVVLVMNPAYVGEINQQLTQFDLYPELHSVPRPRETARRSGTEC